MNILVLDPRRLGCCRFLLLVNVGSSFLWRLRRRRGTTLPVRVETSRKALTRTRWRSTVLVVAGEGGWLPDASDSSALRDPGEVYESRGQE